MPPYCLTVRTFIKFSILLSFSSSVLGRLPTRFCLNCCEEVVAVTPTFATFVGFSVGTSSLGSSSRTLFVKDFLAGDLSSGSGLSLDLSSDMSVSLDLGHFYSPSRFSLMVAHSRYDTTDCSAHSLSS